jgi:predicted dehydrogenase
MSNNNIFTRKRFIETAGAALGGSIIAGPVMSKSADKPVKRKVEGKMRVAVVGLGVRGVGMYGRTLMRNYGDYVDLVGICDTNPGRLDYGHDYIGVDCPTFSNLDEMLETTNPDRLVVTTWDWEHHNCVVAGLEHGVDVVCEKPLTIDEQKCQVIIDADKKYPNDVFVTFNYRYPPHRAKVKELLMEGAIGDIRTVDFHWNIDHAHQMRYMQRWHGESQRGGTLWVHKNTHHFDMINWFLDSDPVEVYAHDALEIFGSNGPFRSTNCRNCPHADRCDYYWDINANDHLRQMYADNEHYDGYIRDNCVFRHNIDSHDKHSALVKYANNAFLNYSLTSDTDHSGYWIAFNGTKGRLEGREGGWPASSDHQEWILTPLGEDPQKIEVPFSPGGHWGGDPLLMDKLFKDPDMADPLYQSAGTRDGVMSVLAGIAARKSAASGRPVKIAGLTSLNPHAKRPAELI